MMMIVNDDGDSDDDYLQKNCNGCDFDDHSMHEAEAKVDDDDCIAITVFVSILVVFENTLRIQNLRWAGLFNINKRLNEHHYHDLHEADPRSRCARLGRSGSLEASDWTSRGSNVNPPS